MLKAQTVIDNDLYESESQGGRIVGYFKNGVFTKLSSDHLSTLVTDEAGQTNIARAYGERETRTETMKVIDYTIKGFDSEIGAIRMGQRYYDPEAKRFLSADNYFVENADKCLKSPVECNLYSYAGNNPVNCVDPTGEYFTPQTWHVFNSAGVGEQVWSEMKAAGNGMVEAAKYAGAAVGLIAVGSAAPVLVAAAAPKVSGLALAATIEMNTAAVSAGMYVARNPQRAEEIVTTSVSIINDVFFEGKGQTPCLPANRYEMVTMLNDFRKEVVNMYDNYVVEHR